MTALRSVHPPTLASWKFRFWALTGRTSPCLHLQRQTNCLQATVETITHNTRGSALWIGLLFSCCHVNVPHMNPEAVRFYLDTGSLSSRGKSEGRQQNRHLLKALRKTHIIDLFPGNTKDQTDGWVREEKRCFPRSEPLLSPRGGAASLVQMLGFHVWLERFSQPLSVTAPHG